MAAFSIVWGRQAAEALAAFGRCRVDIEAEADGDAVPVETGRGIEFDRGPLPERHQRRGSREEINFCRHDWLPSIVADIMTSKDLRMCQHTDFLNYAASGAGKMVMEIA
jgi:hypothetical protein